MPTDTPTGSTRPARKSSHTAVTMSPMANGGHGYVVPLIHLRMPEQVVNGGFWAALAGAALVGAVDPPLAALIGAGVVVARHRTQR